ncbi:MAG: GntR family transcriptional regulator [Clostridiales bacterium]|nr:GntR family transcriptional regulator [Clostridiales bacterium]
MAAPDNRPLYQQIKEDISTQIETKLLLPGDKLPTEQQLTEQYNVSRITVSKALAELKAEGKVVRHPNKGTFIADSDETEPPKNISISVPSGQPAAKNSELYEVAFIIPAIEDFFAMSLIAGVHSVLPDDRYVCVVLPSRSPSTENYLLQRCIDQQVSGIILFPQDQPFFSSQLLYLLLQKSPLVLIDRSLPRLDTSYVISDNPVGGALCVDHLYRLGHRSFCFVSATCLSTFSIQERFNGIRESVVRSGLPKDAVTVVENLDKHADYSSHKELFLNIIKEKKITAFIAAESSTGAYLYSMFTSFGLSIPKDVSLICFDKPFCDSKQTSFFTYIDQAEFQIGQEAGLLLRNRIENNDTNIYHRVLTPHLHPGSSTAPVF